MPSRTGHLSCAGGLLVLLLAAWAGPPGPSGEAPRNWEGLVRLEDRGFLLVTDKFPGTLLGFVPSQPIRR